jgi:hypothetical protein
VFPGKLTACSELTNDFGTFGEIIHVIPKLPMGLERKNLAVDPKATDPVLSTELQRGQQGLSVGSTKAAQLRKQFDSRHPTGGRCRCVDKLDRLVLKGAAEPEANHVELFNRHHFLLKCPSLFTCVPRRGATT